MSHSYSTTTKVLGLLILVAIGLACTIGDYNLFDTSSEGITEADLQATQIVLQATQIAIELQQQQLQQPDQPPDQDQQAPHTPKEPIAPPPDVIYEGVSFNLDPSIAQGVTPETVPADTESPWSSPQHIRFSLNGYPHPDPDTFHSPQIMIFTISEYEAVNEYASDVVADLKQLLQTKPAAPDSISFLPIWNAAQMMRAQVEYLDFQNGSGVRFLTQYGQAAWPINNKDVFYTFQGLTNDGAYYVAAILPVANLILPPDGENVPGGDFAAFSENYLSYVTDIQQQLNNQDAASFTPDLSSLDAMFQSLKIE